MPFALDNVRIADLTWLLAGAGGPRMLTSLGAEDLRIEWKGHLDMIRAGAPIIPVGEDRDRILGGEPGPGTRVGGGINQGGHFAGINAGKRGVSLNLRHPEGKEIFKEIVRISDIVVECFTANTMERLGLGYDELRKVNPSIIYIQQPGFGKRGEYSDFVSTGPAAQAISGLTEQSGLPGPWPPAGWGYSYMDWSGAYYCAMAMLSALYYRSRTGEGQYMDCSQAEPAIYMTGTAILDYVANGRESQRTGNTSPYIPAAPHDVYPVQGEDRWIAIAVFDDDEWRALTGVLGNPAWTGDERFATLASRLRHVKELDERLAGETKQHDGFDLMERCRRRASAPASARPPRTGCSRTPSSNTGASRSTSPTPSSAPGPSRTSRSSSARARPSSAAPSTATSRSTPRTTTTYTASSSTSPTPKSPASATTT